MILATSAHEFSRACFESHKFPHQGTSSSIEELTGT